jgi:hypothetical protein
MKPKRSIFARQFGSHQDADEVSEEPAPKQARTPMAVASLSPPKPQPVAVEHIVPLPTARPKPVAVAAAADAPRPARTVVTASLGGNLFDNRGYWRGAVQTGPDLPAAAAQKVFETASVEPNATGSTALAYASASEALAPARTRPMGTRMPQLPREASVMPAQGNTTTVEKPALAAAGASTSLHSDSPWLRAAMLTPSVSTFMTTTRMGAVDMRPLQGLLYKPATSVTMSFSADPQLGMVASRFDGPAVVFVATTSFAFQSTASLR